MEDDWDEDCVQSSAHSNGYSSNRPASKKSMNNDDGWDDAPGPSSTNGNCDWSGGKTNNVDGWDDQPSGNTQNNGKRNNPFSASDDWNDEEPKKKSARCDWNGGGSSNNDARSDGGSSSYNKPSFKSDRGPRKPDWICDSCQARCFGSRDTCYKCQADKGISKDAPDDGGNGNRGKRKSDWICDACGAKVYGSKTNCFKCQADKGNSRDAPADNGNGGDDDKSNNGTRGKRQGDWDCSCGHNNFASRDKCQKCDEAKPEGARAANGEEGGKVFYIPEEVKDDDLFNAGISTGINFEQYNKIPIEVVDTARNNVPPPIESFASAGLNELILRNVERSGYQKPTPIQKHAIPIILGKRDLMACAQTGSGKTAAFLLPIIQTLLAENIAASIGSPNVVIVTPTRELTTQIFNEARKYSQGSAIKVCQIYGGTASRHQSSILNNGCHILVATMGRLIDYCNRTYVEFNKLRFLVFDEADRMLEQGFLPEIQKMMSHPTMVRNTERQTVMFSATFPDDICHLAGQYLNEQVFLKIGMIGGACADVEQTILKVGRFEKRSKLKEILDAQDGSTLVFVEQKKMADFMASFLSENEIKSTSIHGDRLQQQREQALGDFKSGRMRVLLATAVAARGLDIPNVKLVINFDLPKTIDEYVHRIGRTGRVGNVGKSIAFFDPERNEDTSLVRDLKKVLADAKQTVPDFLESGGGVDDNFGTSTTNSADPPAHGGGGDDEEW